jgi:5-formyltetrahydrofolate cyclo-ligase
MTDLTDLPDKSAIRASVLAARRAAAPAERAAANAQLVRSAVELVRGLTRIAAYTPLPTEPGGPDLVGALTGAVDTVLLPVVRPDRDLDWAPAPAGPGLGPAAIAEVELVLVPAVAVDHAGIRLGRGGGSYDRALARIRPGTPVVALLFDAEVRATLPAQPHDRPVTAVLTPTGLRPIPMS